MNIGGGITIGGGINFLHDSTLVPVSPYGSILYSTPGTYSFTVPEGVTFVSVVCVGGGGGSFTGLSNLPYDASNGAAGGGLAYGNNIAVTPGSTYTVQVGAGGTPLNNTLGTAGPGGNSWFINAASLQAGGGNAATYTSVTTSNLPIALGGTSSGSLRSGGGVGGDGGAISADNTGGGGGGGAGGYNGSGGNGGNVTSSSTGLAGQNGTGGGGGGGGGSGSSSFAGASGGGVGVYGQGSDGTGGSAGGAGAGGVPSGGSGGASGQPRGNGTGQGGSYGGGGAGGPDSTGGATNSAAATGGGGAVRIVWGTGREFPSTDVASTTNETVI